MFQGGSSLDDLWLDLTAEVATQFRVNHCSHPCSCWKMASHRPGVRTASVIDLEVGTIRSHCEPEVRTSKHGYIF